MAHENLANNVKRLTLLYEELAQQAISSDPKIQMMFDQLFTPQTKPMVQCVVTFSDEVLTSQLEKADPNAADFVNCLIQSVRQTPRWTELVNLMHELMTDAPIMRHALIVRAVAKQVALVPIQKSSTRTPDFELSSNDVRFLKSLRIQG